MDSEVRELIFTPLLDGSLRQIIADFTINLPDGPVTSPALVSFGGDKFQFTMHFVGEDPPPCLILPGKTTFTQDDTFAIHGQIASKIAFECRDVFPPCGTSTHSRGTSTLVLESSKMHLVPEGTDQMQSAELRALLGKTPKSEGAEETDFRSHSIFHGPKLRLRNAETNTVRTNDFLGEASKSSMDTHVFSGNGYEGALIQKDKELHLHLRAKEISSKDDGLDWDSLVRRVEKAVAFTHGFQPWPVYREIRKNHRVTERWIACHIDLGQTSLSPISETLWANVHGNSSDPLHQIIPTIADGLGSLPKPIQKGLHNLLWQFRAAELSDLPGTTKLLMICAILDGIMKLLSGKTDPSKKAPTDKTWIAGCAAAGLSWDKWGSDLFELFGKHRQHLAHGWLWLPTNDDPSVYFSDYPKLCGGLNTLVAAACGYEGLVLTDAFRSRALLIKSVKGAKL